MLNKMMIIKLGIEVAKKYPEAEAEAITAEMAKRADMMRNIGVPTEEREKELIKFLKGKLNK